MVTVRSTHAFLASGGECGELIDSFDWGQSPLGLIDEWPASLRSTVANLLNTRQPMLLFWGPELIQFYNDAFIPSIGREKHPRAIGQRARECWADAWPVVGAQIEAVMTRGEPTWFEDALIPIVRNGRMEDVYWTYSYSPAYDDAGAIAGTLVIVTETTTNVLSRRRSKALSHLGDALAAVSTFDDAIAAFGRVVETVPLDVVGWSLDRSVRPRGTDLAFLAGDQTLVLGVSQRLPLDEPYGGFLAQLADRLTAALARIESTDRSLVTLRQLEESDRSKDAFLAMLGHELRNPLAPIVTALDLMQIKGEGPERERAIIGRQVRHVMRLVDDLLDVSKIARGLITIDKESVNLADVIGAAVEANTHLIKSKHHELHVDAPDGHRVIGDESRLVQIVSNLLTNAVRYTPSGGSIRISLTTEGDDVVMRVVDTGAGIEPDLRSKIFGLFVQGAQGPDRRQGGLGLGLSIVRTLVELHGGTVTVESEGQGKGSTFIVRLPRLLPVAPSATPRTRPAVETSKRILFVDDNEDAVFLLGEMAQAWGHTVSIANDPASALRMLPEIHPQIAVLDIGLPGMSGYDLAARVREVDPSCRLIALSGYGTEKDREKSREAGFEAHLVKPIRVEELRAMLAV